MLFKGEIGKDVTRKEVQMSYRYSQNKKAKRKRKDDEWRKKRNQRRNNKVTYNKSTLHTMTPDRAAL